MVGGIPGPGNVIFIPLVNGLCIGVDKDAALRLFKLHAGTVEPSESVFIQSFGKILLCNILESSIDFLFLGLFDIHFPGLRISLEC